MRSSNGSSRSNPERNAAAIAHQNDGVPDAKRGRPILVHLALGIEDGSHEIDDAADVGRDDSRNNGRVRSHAGTILAAVSSSVASVVPREPLH